MSEPRITAAQRRFVAQRANYCCEYCLSQHEFSPDPFSIEHIIPQSKGGTDELENLALACQGCNNKKYNHTQARDPVTGETVTLYHPRQHSWSEHFTWNEDYRLLIGLTPIGRATIERIQLNRSGVMNLRKLLHAVNLHPPDQSIER